jgi:hypothetical protein
MYKLEAVGKSKVQSLSGGVILERVLSIGHVLDAGVVADRRGAMVSLNAADSLGRVEERGSRKFARSYFCRKSINRWCTNAMLARSNARDRLHKAGGPYTGRSVGLLEEARVSRWGNQGHGLKCGWRRAFTLRPSV